MKHIAFIPKNDLVKTSFIRCISSQICKIMPKSPSKFVAVLKHVIDQSSKSPHKKYYIDKFLLKQGMNDSKYLGQYLFQLGKFKAKKDDKKILTDCICNKGKIQEFTFCLALHRL